MAASTTLLLFPLLQLLLLLAAESEDRQAPIHINKCCWKSERIDMERQNCVEKALQKTDYTPSEVLTSPIDVEAASWVPDVLRSRTIFVHYDVLPDADLKVVLNINNTGVVEKFLRIDASAGRFAFLDRFIPPVDPNLVWKQSFCFDRSLNSPMSDVVISWVFTRKVIKCCPPGERLAADARNCETVNDAKLLPATPLANASAKRKGHVPFYWNVALPLKAKDRSRWRLMAPLGRPEFSAWVRGSVGGREVQGVAWKYCVDAAAPGEFSPKVLLAAVADVRKCCPRAQILSENGQQCEAVTEEGVGKSDEEEGMEWVVGEETVDNSTWVPPALKTFLNASEGVVTVAYNTKWYFLSTITIDADVAGEWVMKWPEDLPPELWLTGGSPDARHKLRKWCFDAQSGRGRVLVAELPCYDAGVLCLSKCCPMGALLGPDGRCRTRPAHVRAWDPSASAAAPFLPKNHTLFAQYIPDTPCVEGTFVTHSPDGERAAQHLQYAFQNTHFRFFFHCADSQLGDGGTVKETFAYCEYPPIAGVYAVVRPLQLLAVLFLAVGLAAILREQHTRRSMHGCALACHAVCLLLSNALQTAWFFTRLVSYGCYILAYIIYFFLVAAGVWLNVVSINMAWSFRQPLGAQSAGQRRRPMWQSLALWCAYGWGVPAALTALAVCMYINSDELKKNYTVPTFFETRTCLGEVLSHIKGTGQVVVGTIFYYYVPMSILVVANGMCLILTTSKILAIKRETAVLHTKGASTAASRGLQNVRMYVKLLLSAGLLEIVLEVTSWAVRQYNWSPYATFKIYNTIHETQQVYIFHIATTFVDIARALAVLWLAVGRWHWPWAWPGSWWRHVGARAAMVRGAWRQPPAPIFVTAPVETNTTSF